MYRHKQLCQNIFVYFGLTKTTWCRGINIDDKELLYSLLSIEYRY